MAWKLSDIKFDEKLKAESILLVGSLIYIIFFVNLDYSFDWDTMVRVASLKSGIIKEMSVTHLMVTVPPKLLVILGQSPLAAFKIVISVLMLSLVIGAFEFTFRETKEISMALMAALLLLFNFGFTFLLTTLEDNLFMYGLLLPAVIFLFMERWALSAFFFSLGMLMHVEMEVFVPILIFYGIFKSGLLDGLVNKRGPSVDGQVPNDRPDLARLLKGAILPALVFLIPLGLSYAYLILARGDFLDNIATHLMVSGKAYRSDPTLWYFASGKSLNEWLSLAYYGFVSTFVCRYPEFLENMPLAPYFGGMIAVPITYILVRSFSLSYKFLAALPTFLVLLVHDIFYESWSIERWDYLPFFLMFFAAVSYCALSEGSKKNLRGALALVVIMSAMFTFGGYNAICGLQSSATYSYIEKASEIMDGRSVLIDPTLKPNEANGLLASYYLGKKLIIPKQTMDLQKVISIRDVYLSNMNFESTKSKIPTTIKVENVWDNKIDSRYGLVKLSKKG